METEKSVIQAEQVTLSSDDQEAIISFVKQCWNKGEKDRSKYLDDAKDCEKAYHCEMEPITSPELDWMSNICLPWAFDASESWFSHIRNTTIPRNDKIFSISGRTIEDHPGAETMEKYLSYRFDRNKFAEKLGQAEKDLAIRNHACLKVYWKEETTVRYNWVEEPVTQDVPDELTGQLYTIQTGTRRVRKPQEEVTFNNVWIDNVPLEQFVMYPIRGDIRKTTRIHETYRHYEDLMANKDNTNYFNLEQLSLDDEKQADTEKDGIKNQNKGLKIKEAWIYRVVINGKVYRNYVATIVNDKVLVRFQPFPPGCPDSPFVFIALRPDGDCLYGYGLNSKGLGLLSSANKKFNAWIDEGQLTQHQAHKYYDDGVFNPNAIVRRPGAMIKLSGPESVAQNLVPLIDDKSAQQLLMQDLAALKVEFEQVTVPKVVKGMIDVGRESTATEQTLAQNNSSGKMDVDAHHIDDDLIHPVISLAYQAIYERAQWDQSIVDEMRQVTLPKDPNGTPIGTLPILPLPEVDIKIVGYQNTIRKQQTLMAMGQIIPQLMQSPAAKYIKWDNTAEDTMKLAELDTDRLLLDEAGRQKADQAEAQAQQQQQDLLVQKEMMTLQLQQQKQQQDYEIALAELELKRQQLELDAQVAAQKAQLDAKAQADKAALDEHNASLAAEQQAFNQSQTDKEKLSA